MNEPIQVMVGIATENNKEPMGFLIYDDGIKFSNDFTHQDLTIAYAVLMDLADAINEKLRIMTN